MSVFINYNKNSKMTVEFELNNNGSDNMNIEEIEAIEIFEELQNNIEYNIICEKDEEENKTMDNVIIDIDYDDYGIEKTTIAFEDEIRGDFYYTASGGAFDSASDYWNYILG